MFFDASMQVDGRKGKMVDINSMYPHIMNSGKMPLDHPAVKVGPPSRFDTSPDVYFGLVKAKVYPPRGLFFPVLPSRVPVSSGNTKLMFTLCRTCAQHRQQESCSHTDEERALSETWFSEGLYAAQKRGYKIINMTAVWDYSLFPICEEILCRQSTVEWVSQELQYGREEGSIRPRFRRKRGYQVGSFEDGPQCWK